jgi:hypothetical protein
MEKADKIAFSAILVISSALILGLLWAVKLVGAAVFGWFDDASAGVGFKDALIWATILSTLLLVLFALVAGDGIVGELPSMIVGFAMFTAFFTFSVAWIF